MSASELAVEKVRALSEEEAKAVLQFIAETFSDDNNRNSAAELEAACRAANNDPALAREIAEWQSFHDSLPD
jgi:hypothetical protein